MLKLYLKSIQQLSCRVATWRSFTLQTSCNNLECTLCLLKSTLKSPPITRQWSLYCSVIAITSARTELNSSAAAVSDSYIYMLYTNADSLMNKRQELIIRLSFFKSKTTHYCYFFFNNFYSSIYIDRKLTNEEKNNECTTFPGTTCKVNFHSCNTSAGNFFAFWQVKNLAIQSLKGLRNPL